MERERLGPDELVARLGPHPLTRSGLELDEAPGDVASDGALESWLVLSLLLGGRTREKTALAAFSALQRQGATTAAGVAAIGASGLHRVLDGADLPKSEATAALLSRVCGALERGWGGSLDRLAADAEGLESLARRLSGLGAGFGRAAVLRFLTPLRQRWSAANDLPGTPAATHAAACLGLVVDGNDAEALPAAIASWLRNASGDGDVTDAIPRARDVEWALERLGRAACLRGRRDRCPLGSGCPGAGSRDRAKEGEEWE